MIGCYQQITTILHIRVEIVKIDLVVSDCIYLLCCIDVTVKYNFEICVIQQSTFICNSRSCIYLVFQSLSKICNESQMNYEFSFRSKRWMRIQMIVTTICPQMCSSLVVVTVAGGDIVTRRSHTGYILMMNGGPISWKSHRQDNVSLSTSESEFVAASQAA